MIYRDEQPPFRRISQQTLNIGLPPLQFDMVVFRYPYTPACISVPLGIVQVTSSLRKKSGW